MFNKSPPPPPPPPATALSTYSLVVNTLLDDDESMVESQTTGKTNVLFPREIKSPVKSIEAFSIISVAVSFIKSFTVKLPYIFVDLISLNVGSLIILYNYIII